jgi:lipid A 3-O-deacylase
MNRSSKLSTPATERKDNLRHETLALVIGFIFVAWAGVGIGGETPPQPAATNSMAHPGAEFLEPKSAIWQDDVGEGFLPTAETFSLEAGLGLGIKAFGSQQAHDLGLISLTYGHMLSQVRGEGHWYRGNWEVRLELFGGMQFRPDVDTDGWLVGLAPHLRYNFATGSRWIPFLDGGAGVTATGIGPPDLSGTFEFNLQATAGTHWFIDDNLALTGEVRYMHMSCGGIHAPNLGINDVVFMLGVTWFFGKK